MMERLITFCVLFYLSSIAGALPYPETYPEGYNNAYGQPQYQQYTNLGQPQASFTPRETQQYGQHASYSPGTPNYGNSYVQYSNNAGPNYGSFLNKNAPLPSRQNYENYVSTLPPQRHFQNHFEEQIAEQQQVLNDKLASQIIAQNAANQVLQKNSEQYVNVPIHQQIEEQIQEQINSQQQVINERVASKILAQNAINQALHRNSEPYINVPVQQQIQEQQQAINEKIASQTRVQNAAHQSLRRISEPYVNVPVHNYPSVNIYEEPIHSTSLSQAIFNEQQLPQLKNPTQAQWKSPPMTDYNSNPTAEFRTPVPQTTNHYQKLYQQYLSSSGISSQESQNLWKQYSDSNASPNHEKRYLVIYPDGRKEYVDKLELIAQKHPNYLLLNNKPTKAIISDTPNESLTNVAEVAELSEASVDNHPVLNDNAAPNAVDEVAELTEASVDNHPVLNNNAAPDALAEVAELTVDSVDNHRVLNNNAAPDAVAEVAELTEVSVDNHRVLNDNAAPDAVAEVAELTEVSVDNHTVLNDNAAPDASIVDGPSPSVTSTTIEESEVSNVSQTTTETELTQKQIAPDSTQSQSSESIEATQTSKTTNTVASKDTTETVISASDSSTTAQTVATDTSANTTSCSTVTTLDNVSNNDNSSDEIEVILQGASGTKPTYLGTINATPNSTIDSLLLRKILGEDETANVYFFLVKPQPVITQFIRQEIFPNGTIVEENVTSRQDNVNAEPTVTVSRRFIPAALE